MEGSFMEVCEGTLVCEFKYFVCKISAKEKTV